MENDFFCFNAYDVNYDENIYLYTLTRSSSVSVSTAITNTAQHFCKIVKQNKKKKTKQIMKINLIYIKIIIKSYITLKERNKVKPEIYQLKYILTFFLTYMY